MRFWHIGARCKGEVSGPHVPSFGVFRAIPHESRRPLELANGAEADWVEHRFSGAVVTRNKNYSFLPKLSRFAGVRQQAKP